VGDAALLGVDLGAAEIFGGNLLAGHGLDHVGSRDVHLADPVHHEDKVAQGRGVHGAPRAGPQDEAELRDDAGGQGVPEKNRPVLPQSFLDAGASRIDDPDDGGPDLDRQIHHMADLARVRLAERSAHDREILRIDVDQTAVDRSRTGDHPVAVNLLPVHSELRRLMGNEHLEFGEASRVQHHVDPLPGAELASLVLLVGLLPTAPQPRLGRPGLQLLIFFPQRLNPLSHFV